MKQMKVIRAYLRKKADPYHEYGLERERWKPQDPKRLRPTHSPAQVRKLLAPNLHFIDEDNVSSLRVYLDESGKINKPMREQQGEGDKTIEQLKHLVNKSRLAERTVLYRGIRFDPSHPLCQKLLEIGVVRMVPRQEKDQRPFVAPNNDRVSLVPLEGFTFHEPSFISTSISPRVAGGFIAYSSYGILFEVMVEPEASGLVMPQLQLKNQRHETRKFENAFENELEVILPPTTFKVKSATLTKNSNHISIFVVRLTIAT